MTRVIQAGAFYFMTVFGAGFMLGIVRVPILVPRIGERWAELAEMPIMATVIFLGAGLMLRRFPEVRTRGRSLATGVLALALLVGAELGFAAILQDKTLAEYIVGRDKVSGAAYVVLLMVFAVMPRLRRSVCRPPAGRLGR